MSESLGKEPDGDPTRKGMALAGHGDPPHSSARSALLCDLAESLGLSDPWPAGQQGQNPDEPGGLPGSDAAVLGPPKLSHS